MKKRKESEKKEGLVQAVLKGLGLGKLVKEAEKTILFKKRFKEVNEEIEEKLKKGKR
ncbi:MAG: hypothetical protein ABH850_02080 [Candidatus Micrarchaeota archaeon]